MKILCRSPISAPMSMKLQGNPIVGSVSDMFYPAQINAQESEPQEPAIEKQPF